jgi:hypothetical protein
VKKIKSESATFEIARGDPSQHRLKSRTSAEVAAPIAAFEIAHIGRGRGADRGADKNTRFMTKHPVL